MRPSLLISKDEPSFLRNALREEKGLSLLEILIAIIILAIALTSISYFFSQARGNIEATGRMRCGLALAQDKMEELKDLGYSHPDLSEGTHSDQVDIDENEKMDFYREWTVSPVPDPANGTDETMDYKLVELRVYDLRPTDETEPLNNPNRLVCELKTYISP